MMLTSGRVVRENCWMLYIECRYIYSIYVWIRRR